MVLKYSSISLDVSHRGVVVQCRILRPFIQTSETGRQARYWGGIMSLSQSGPSTPASLATDDAMNVE